MQSSETKSPVIVIGMHRSGTSLVTRMMEQMGVFMGVCQDTNSEAEFFRLLNRWIFYQCGAAWDQPGPIRNLIENTEVRRLVTDYLRYMLGTRHAVSYLGWWKFLKYRNILRIGSPWGWKDPSNTFTLPLWLDIFPHAKIVHVVRHGVDVAQSLLNRERNFLVAAEKLHERRKRRHEYWFRAKESGFVSSLRCFSLEGGFSLWEEYVAQARLRTSTAINQSIELKYEDLLQQPRESIYQLSLFCEISVTDMKVQEIVRSVDATKAFQYRNDHRLIEFANIVAKRLYRLGYPADELGKADHDLGRDAICTNN
ncbi:MAG: sulfotransferase [Chloroflexi bacterium]|nr:MAG: sulfotransferase [Chloroflexota bacterium]